MNWIAAIAKTISKVMNPFALSVVLLLLVAVTESSSLKLLLTSVLVVLIFLAVLPLAYVYVRTSLRANKTKSVEDPVTFFRQHRKEIFVIGLVAAVPCIISLILLKAPSLLLATLLILLITSLGMALVNRYFRASYHLAAITNIVAVVIFVWGWAFLPILAVIPLVGWARYSLRQHSPMQLAVGFCLAASITPAVLYSFTFVKSIL